jgi:DNA primase
MPVDLARASLDRAQFTNVPGHAHRDGSFYKRYEGPNPYRGRFLLDNDLLDDYRLAPKSLLDAGFQKNTLKHFEVGFDYKNLRVTYPIRNIFGELVGVSGRTVIDQEPRYKLYKQELVELGVPEDYSLDSVKKGLLWHAHIVYPILYKISEPIIITEGFKATMWVWQSSIHDTVALIGSYLTDLHANLLTTLRCPVFLFLDNNEAGHIGTWKAIRKLNAIELYVAKYPDLREQPDELTTDEVRCALRHAYSRTEWIKENRNVIRQSSKPTGTKRRL